ncbi:variable surface protein [Plasmodium gonderi]|uniref:Variable surface protein n=1 Tax=Plasmodium gonderi TaxID=77519 RepID=A0A1Y1JPQ9_PLAGO|nr:variable surface protein [Plasmodium gonderi]GAW84606.1 variable surface protein [Plasmodium gonderi]
MSEIKINGKDLDFNSIFPTCINGFNWAPHLHTGNQLFHKLTTLCSAFRLEVTSHTLSDHSFINNCNILSLYLDHITKRINDDNKEACCKYFYYKLKKYILNNRDCNCSGSKDCYEKLIEKIGINSEAQISDICWNHVINIDTDTFSTLEKLDNLYSTFNTFNNAALPNKSDIYKFIYALKDLEKSIDKYHDSFKLSLQQANADYISFVKTLEEKGPQGKILLIYLKQDGYINGILKVVLGTNEKEESTEGNTNIGAIIDAYTDSGAGTGTGIVILTFAILVTVYILYKYTPYFSFLKPRVRKLRKVLKKNNKNYLDFMGRFDVEYKNSIDDEHKISYSSANYRH